MFLYVLSCSYILLILNIHQPYDIQWRLATSLRIQIQTYFTFYVQMVAAEWGTDRPTMHWSFDVYNGLKGPCHFGGWSFWAMSRWCAARYLETAETCPTGYMVVDMKLNINMGAMNGRDYLPILSVISMAFKKTQSQHGSVFSTHMFCSRGVDPPAGPLESLHGTPETYSMFEFHRSQRNDRFQYLETCLSYWNWSFLRLPQ